MRWSCTADDIRIAIVGCCAYNQEKMTYGGTKWTARELVSKKIQAFAHWKGVRLRPEVFWPVGRNYDYPDFEKYDAIIIPGSKLNADAEGIYNNPWMDGLFEFIRDVTAKKPLLGICFGHQAIAVAHGVRLKPIPKPHNAEIGFVPIYKTHYAAHDKLFKDLPNDFEGLFSHFRYLSSAPRGSRVLAHGELPEMVQAYRMGENTWGVQFHPDYSGYNVGEIIEQRKPWLSKMVNLSAVKTQTQKRHDEQVLVNFVDYALNNLQ